MSSHRPADEVGGRKDAVEADHTALGVSLVIRDPDVEVAGVWPAQPAEARCPERGRRQLRPMRLRPAEPYRIDRHADGRERP
jgi:hypothetical protein